MDNETIAVVRDTLGRYCEAMGKNEILTLYLVSGAELHIKSAPRQDEQSIFVDLIDTLDNDLSVRLDQIAAIRSVEGGATAMVI